MLAVRTDYTVYMHSLIVVISSQCPHVFIINGEKLIHENSRLNNDLLKNNVHSAVEWDYENVRKRYYLSKKKGVWIRKLISILHISPVLLSSDIIETGGFVLLLNQFKFEYPAEYKLTLRMTPQNFDELLSLVKGPIKRQDTFKSMLCQPNLASGISHQSILPCL